MIKTGIGKLDQLLKGGIRSGIITDIFGATGTGKTQLAMQISVNSLEAGGRVFFLDTTGKFRPERMLDFIKSRDLDPKLLDNVKVFRTTNTSEQISNLSKIKEDDYSLVVIDNITDLFSFEYTKEDQNLEKNSIFMRYMHDLSFNAIQNNLPVIITNMIRSFGDKEVENFEKPIELYTHVKIHLFKNGKKHFGKIYPALLEEKEFEYQITKNGLEESS